eukprot:gene23812-9375_t
MQDGGPVYKITATKFTNDMKSYPALSPLVRGKLLSQCETSEDLPTNKSQTQQKRSYQISRPRERWTEEERAKFLEGLRIYGRGHWRKIGEFVGTKTAVQIRSHAQKVMGKLKAQELDQQQTGWTSNTTTTMLLGTGGSIGQGCHGSNADSMGDAMTRAITTSVREGMLAGIQLQGQRGSGSSEGEGSEGGSSGAGSNRRVLETVASAAGAAAAAAANAVLMAAGEDVANVIRKMAAMGKLPHLLDPFRRQPSGLQPAWARQAVAINATQPDAQPQQEALDSKNPSGPRILTDNRVEGGSGKGGSGEGGSAGNGGSNDSPTGRDQTKEPKRLDLPEQQERQQFLSQPVLFSLNAKEANVGAGTEPVQRPQSQPFQVLKPQVRQAQFLTSNLRHCSSGLGSKLGSSGALSIGLQPTARNFAQQEHQQSLSPEVHLAPPSKPTTPLGLDSCYLSALSHASNPSLASLLVPNISGTAPFSSLLDPMDSISGRNLSFQRVPTSAGPSMITADALLAAHQAVGPSLGFDLGGSLGAGGDILNPLLLQSPFNPQSWLATRAAADPMLQAQYNLPSLHLQRLDTPNLQSHHLLPNWQQMSEVPLLGPPQGLHFPCQQHQYQQQLQFSVPQLPQGAEAVPVPNVQPLPFSLADALSHQGLTLEQTLQLNQVTNALNLAQSLAGQLAASLQDPHLNDVQRMWSPLTGKTRRRVSVSVSGFM